MAHYADQENLHSLGRDFLSYKKQTQSAYQVGIPKIHSSEVT